MKQIHLQNLFSTIYNKPIPRIHCHKSNFSSSSLLKPHSGNPSFNPNNHIRLLCRENRFQEAVCLLCGQKRLREAIQVLDLIDQSKATPSAAIYSALLRLCIEFRELSATKRVHESIRKSEFVAGVFISNRLIDLYAKCGCLVSARKVFDEMRERDLCSWNTMISGYVKGGQVEEGYGLFREMPEKDNFTWSTMISGYVTYDRPKESLELFRRMQREACLKSNKFTVSSALAAISALKSLRLGKEIHGNIMRTGLDSDTVIWSALSDMYGKCGSIDEARHIFDKMLDRDVVTWTAMIGRYFEKGRRREGFELFSELLRSGIRPNEFTFAAVLNACSDQASEDTGKAVHAYMTRIGYDPFSFAASALVHMFSKCGNIGVAKKVFGGILQADIVSWTSLIAGYAQNGQHEKALHNFELLLKSGTKPDHVMFVGVLSACTRAGLVDKGLEHFHSITKKHGLTLTANHYACVIDLLRRSGRFKKLKK